METIYRPTVWIGLDVSKDKLDACLIKTEGKPLWKIFPNSTAGHQKLLRWAKHMAGEAACHFGLEATGAYGLYQLRQNTYHSVRSKNSAYDN
jgi:transposase